MFSLASREAPKYSSLTLALLGALIGLILGLFIVGFIGFLSLAVLALLSKLECVPPPRG